MELPTITTTWRLQFAIRFAQMDLETLRPGDWLNLRDDLAVFLGYALGIYEREQKGELDTSDLQGTLPQAFTEADFRSLQADVKQVLQSLVHRGMVNLEPKEISAAYSLFNSPNGSFRVLRARGTTHDMFLLRLFFLLNQQPLDCIRRCPECSTIFYRIKKQQYCSRACTNKANVRNWRQSEEVKEKEREKARERYVAKRTTRTGKPLKVQRKPRKQLPT
jgi:hypothetical protein